MRARLRTAASVTRTRIGRRAGHMRPRSCGSVRELVDSGCTLCSQSVPGPADRLDGTRPERPVDLVPEESNVDVHDIRVAFVREVPDVLEEPAARDDLAGMTHEELQHREFLARQLDGDLPATHSLGRGIEGQVTHLEHWRALAGPAPNERAEPRPQLLQIEWLGEVVVGARVEAAGAVGNGVAGGEHEDRHPPARLPEPCTHLET